VKILFINPPFQRLKNISSIYFPLGLGYLGAISKELGWETKIYNAELPSSNEILTQETVDNLLQKHYLYVNSLQNPNHLVWKEMTQLFNFFKPDVIAITTMTAKYSSAKYISAIAKILLPKSIVIWGGSHPTVMPEDALKLNEVDFVVRGEGETTLKLLLNSFTNNISLDEIPGISYKINGAFKHNKQNQLIENLDTIPLPLRNASFFPERYQDSDMSGLITSRGCPFKCGFCSAKNTWTRKVRYHSTQYSINEINSLIKTYNLKHLFFWDDSFTSNKQRTINLCNELLKNRIKTSWSCTTRINILDNELLSHMKRAGCVNIDIGIESGSDRILKEINKNLTTLDIRSGLKMIRNHGINVNAYFMIGFPTEKQEDLELTKLLMNDKNMGKVLFSIFTPYPGTELFDQTNNLGLIPKNIDWSNFSHQSPENHFLKHINKEEFSKLVQNFNETVKTHNSKFSTLWKVHKTKIPLYLKNPIKFVNLIAKYLFIR